MQSVVVAMALIRIVIMIIAIFLLDQCHMEEDSVASVDHSEEDLVDRSEEDLVDHSEEDLVDHSEEDSEDHTVGMAAATITCAESTY